jgi:hypothetical protein
MAIDSPVFSSAGQATTGDRFDMRPQARRADPKFLQHLRERHLSNQRTIICCEKCSRADDVALPTTKSDGALEYTCSGSHQGSGPHVWSVNPKNWALPASGGRREGDNVTDDLLDPLMRCFAGPNVWLEYGVVEFELRGIAPKLFAQHVAEAGHVMLGKTGGETASKNRFSVALQRLERDGLLVHRSDASTGAAWKQTSPISFWAVPPGPPKAKTLTWSAFCAERGRSNDWVREDLAGCQGSTP